LFLIIVNALEEYCAQGIIDSCVYVLMHACERIRNSVRERFNNLFIMQNQDRIKIKSS